MSQNGKIGCGWYEDIVGDETDELQLLATGLLRDKLTEAFNLAKERKHEREIMRQSRQRDGEK